MGQLLPTMQPPATTAVSGQLLPTMQPPAATAVSVTVHLLSGREIEVLVEPSDLIADLQQKVEEKLGVDWLEEVQLIVGSELLSQDARVAKLVVQRGGQAVAVQAVATPSTAKATRVLRSEDFRKFACRFESILNSPQFEYEIGAVVFRWVRDEERMLSKYAEVLQLLVDNSCDVSGILKGYKRIEWIDLQDLRGRLGVPRDLDVHSCERFVTLLNFLRYTRMDFGRRRFSDEGRGWFWREALFYTFGLCNWGRVHESMREIFNEPAIADIKNPDVSLWIQEAWAYIDDSIRGAAALHAAFRCLASAHPQAAVRLAASEEMIRRGWAPPSSPPLSAPAARGTHRDRPEAEAAAAAAAPQATGSGEQEVNEIAEAVERSNQEALEREGQQVSEALLRSKADRWSADGVILARLTFHTTELLELLRNSSLLGRCRARVHEAGCEPSPSWARGALLLVPATEEQIAEAGIQLKPYHILMLSEDKALVEQELSGLPHRRRPTVQPERYAEGKGSSEGRSGTEAGKTPEATIRASYERAESQNEASKETAGGGSRAADRPNVAEFGFMDRLVVERTFLSFPIGKDVSEASDVLASAPACPGQEPESPNPRRWRLKAGEP